VIADVTQEENDVQQLHPMLEQTQEELSAAGVVEEIGVVAADAGYWSETNVQEADPEGPELLIATTKDWKSKILTRATQSAAGEGTTARTDSEESVVIGTNGAQAEDQVWVGALQPTRLDGGACVRSRQGCEEV